MELYAGPIHEVTWSPKGDYFITISGFMPAHTVLYSKKGHPVFKFGSHHRNTVFWAPDQNLFALAGFENLKGEIDIWDLQQRKKIGSCSSNLASYLRWSPDSKYFFTAIV